MKQAEQKHTDKRTLIRGVKFMAFTIPLLFLSPYLITLAFLNKDNFVIYIVLPIGILVGAAAIYLGFKGINTILKAIF